MDWNSRNTNFNALIKQLFHGRGWKNRADAALELGLLKDARAVNLLCRALESERDPGVLNNIIEALGRIGDPKATLRIIDKLKEEIDNFKNNKLEFDKLKVIIIIESLKKIKDKRALPFISIFLNSSTEELKLLVEQAFDEIEPDWRRIVDKERQEKSIQDIFKVNL
ncbi:MAG: HEAT repeat domain-containing protein [Promethearchaeota archaeon]|nr:MAG: HEAT repeat domain-containing protein [Candidatus Lokiarchaeota archaeon]